MDLRRVLLCLATSFLLIGCQNSQIVRQESNVISQVDDVVICYSLLDPEMGIDRTEALRSLKQRNITSCLAVIADHECPEDLSDRRECIDRVKVSVMNDVESMSNSSTSGGTEILIRGAGMAVGILPF